MNIKKPDLPAQHCRSIDIRGYTLVPNKIFEKMLNEKSRKEGYLIAVSQYSKRKNKHLCFFVVPNFKRMNKKKTRVNFKIEIRSSVYLRKQDLLHMEDSFKILNLMKQNKVIIRYGRINAVFNYRRDSYESLIPIPYGASMPILERVEIVGLRFKMQEPAEEEYSQIIDAGKRKTIFHSVSFNFRDYLIEDNFLLQFLNKLSSYSMRLVRERKKKNAKK